MWGRRDIPDYGPELEELTWWVLDIRSDVKLIRQILEDEHGWEDPEENA
jgi:hypothetical protein